MAQLKVLVRKAVAVDGAAASAIVSSEVSTFPIRVETRESLTQARKLAEIEVSLPQHACDWANNAAWSQIQQRASCMIYGITLTHIWNYLGT